MPRQPLSLALSWELALPGGQKEGGRGDGPEEGIWTGPTASSVALEGSRLPKNCVYPK